MRERMLGVIRGDEVDRVPFAQYDGCGGPTEEVWDLVGRENVGVVRWVQTHTVQSPNCRFESEDFERQGRRGYTTTLHTPLGELTEERLYQPDLGCTAIRKHYVKEPEDYRVLASYLGDVVVEDNPDALPRVEQGLGDDGLPHVSVDRTPYQQLWVQ